MINIQPWVKAICELFSAAEEPKHENLIDTSELAKLFSRSVSQRMKVSSRSALSSLTAALKKINSKKP